MTIGTSATIGYTHWLSIPTQKASWVARSIQNL